MARTGNQFVAHRIALPVRIRDSRLYCRCRTPSRTGAPLPAPRRVLGFADRHGAGGGGAWAKAGHADPIRAFGLGLLLYLLLLLFGP